MKSKEDILEEIANAGKRGMTATELFGRKKEDIRTGKELLGELIDAGKIVKKGNRFFLRGIRPSSKKENYITRKEFDYAISEIYKSLSQLKEEIDRAFEYVDEIFIHMAKNEGQKKLPSDEEMLIAYENARMKNHVSEEVPVPLFKEELRRMGFEFKDEELDKKLLELHEKGIVFLRRSENKEKGGIKTENGNLSYIVWVKRGE